MKLLIATLSALVMTSMVVFAETGEKPPFQKEDSARIPTGKDVKGCTHYYLKKGRVVQVCEPTKPGNPLFWDFVAPPSGGGE